MPSLRLNIERRMNHLHGTVIPAFASSDPPGLADPPHSDIAYIDITDNMYFDMCMPATNHMVQINALQAPRQRQQILTT
jgi:hypothetical protein